MFDSLKKKLKEGVSRLSKGAEGPTESKEERPIEKAPETKPVKKPKPRKAETKPVKPKPSRPKAVEKRRAAKKGPVKEKPLSEEQRIEKEAVIEEAPEPEAPKEEPVKEESPEPEPKKEPEKRGRFSRFLGVRERVVSRELSVKDIDGFFDDSELDLLQSDVAVEVADSLREKLKEKLVSSKVRRGGTGEFVRQAFEESLLEIVDQGRIILESMIKKSRKAGKPLLIVFLGFNGSGKTTSIAKMASYLKGKGFRPILAAGDTFRAASIEQLEVHGERLGVKVIKHQYGSDSAAVIFDAMKYAEKSRLDVVLADTAGRAHTDRNLMDELKKVVRVNSPDLRVLVVDSLTGNDAVEQARQFHEAVGVDCVVMTKTDVNPRGGSILSVVHTIGKPILFLGTGQDYKNVEMFDPKRFVKKLLD